MIKLKMKDIKSKKIDLIFKSLLSVFIFGFSLLTADFAQAATLYFSPSSGNFSVGDILTTSVLVNTQSKAINTADAVINFPAGLLEVVSVNKSGSIFSLWVEEPAFSNSAGTIMFNGGLPTPGFTGTAGKMINIVFRVKNSGTASLVFSSGAVRANDGFGTDILQTKAQAQYNLITEEKPVVPPPAPVAPPDTTVAPPTSGVPQAPNISSPTHPDQDEWYAQSTATLTWPVSNNVTAARLLIGKIPSAAPTVLYAPPISKRTVDDLTDGVWYFHAQLRNNSGWGSTTHFRLQIDTKNPERFNIELAPREDPTDPKVKFSFDAVDATSGIDHYEVQIDGKEPLIWRDDGSKIFEAPVLDIGLHILTAKAVDKAGNFLASSIEFKIEPLLSPEIVEYPRELIVGEMLIVRGETYLNAEVTVWLQREDRTPAKHTVRSDGAGSFTLVIEKGLETGDYKAWAEVTDNRGARSAESEKVIIIVKQPKQPAFIQIGNFALGVLSIFIPLIALILLLVYLAWHWWHKFTTMRNRVRKEIREAELALHGAFDLLKEAIRKQIKMLEKTRTKRELTKEEEKIIKRLKKDLDDAEKFVKKEIEDIERTIK